MTAPQGLHMWQPRSQMRRVRDMVARAFHIRPEALPGASRHRPIVIARHAACHVLRQVYPELSYPQIGVLLGGRDQSTMIHGYRQTEERMARDAPLAARIEALVAGGKSLRQQAGRMAIEEERAAVRQMLREMGIKDDPEPVARVKHSPRPVRGAVPVAPPRDVKARNALDPDDSDALARRRGTLALGAALRQARQNSGTEVA